MNRVIVAAFALVALFAGCDRQNERVVAKVDGEIVTQTEAAGELRNLLWRRGETWSELNTEEKKARRETAMGNLINNRLIANFAAQHPDNPPSLQRESEDEFQQFLKQFPPPDEWRERMILQGIDETALRKRISNETKHLDALEYWLAQQPGKVSEADARKWVAAHTKELTIPERVRASHIFLTRHDKEKPERESEIRELHRKITAGEATFEELAMKISDDDSAKMQSGDLGWFTRNHVPPEFVEKVFALPAGEVSAPLGSHLGWHIVLVKEKLPQRMATFDEIKDEITARLDREWRETNVKRLIDELRAKATIERFVSQISAIEP